FSSVGTPADEPSRAKLLIAFASYRDRPKHPNVYFYEHDGVSSGKIIGMVGGTPQRTADAYAHPSLSHDGRYCAYTFELENNAGRIQLWDLKEQKNNDLAAVNTSPNAQMAPTLSGSGKLLAFAAWNRSGGSQGWHIFLHDLESKKMLDLPDL